MNSPDKRDAKSEVSLIPPTVKELIRQALPMDKMIPLIAEGIVAEKFIHSRSEGIVYQPDWQARVKYMELRLKLGGELEDDATTGETNKTVNLIINGKKLYSEKEGL